MRNYMMRRDTSPTSYAILDLAPRYGFPPPGPQTSKVPPIGIINMAGGIVPANIGAFLKAQGVQQTPTIFIKDINGGKNAPGGGEDDEQYLDYGMIATLCPWATIIGYNVVPTTQGFVDGTQAAMADGCGFLSISYGSPEIALEPQEITSVDDAFQQAIAAGMHIQAASGDGGAGDRLKRGETCDFPSSSSNVLACGGTSLTDPLESAWNDMQQGGGSTGGGESRSFAPQAWQAGFYITDLHYLRYPLVGRGSPDISANADPDSGWRLWNVTTPMVVGGTSAVAPFITALLAQIESNRTSRLPAPIAPVLYDKVLTMAGIKQGNNGWWSCPKDGSWSACTGLGVPTPALVQALIAA